MQQHVDLSAGQEKHMPYKNEPQVPSAFSESTRASLGGSLAGSVVDQVRITVDKGITEIRGHMQNTSSTVRAGSFLGGLGVVFVALLSLLNVFRIAYDGVDYLVNMYQLFFGLITIFLEGKREWPGVARIQELIYREAHFLSLVNGRALFYLFEGSLFIIQMQLLQIIAGAYMATLGVLMLYQGGKKGFSSINDADQSLNQNLTSVERE